ncbi:MAG: SpoIIE family protein phosphatase [Chitinivibrionia bacterium]|nr:SpoIIE family protein phosphatase [Chitinivibrionia bacterium]
MENETALSSKRKLIHNEGNKCVGCNHCVRVCPVDEANVVREINGKIIVKIDNEKCIVCGACQKACHHGSRYYEDDAERFFADLKRGVKISMFTAPAAKSNFSDFGRIIAWLRDLGVNKIYDVSLGADICTWGYLRYIDRNKPPHLITQPCPVIVNYILMHRHELIQYLSPVHSPMLCTAIYMRDYEGITDKIAALSPCIAKSCEFKATGMVDYNITIKTFQEYIEKNNIALPEKPSGFDHYDAGIGSLYPLPGGLKETIEHYVGKTLRVDKSEGTEVVYDALDKYCESNPDSLPVVFDVLNCADGCNLGTGCECDDKNIFEINARMDKIRQTAIDSQKSRQYLDDLFAKFDERLQLDDFIREYAPINVKKITITEEGIENAFISLGKTDEESRHHDCGACGNDRCTQMAEQIAKGVNIFQNCTEYVAMMLHIEKNEAKEAHDNIVAGITYASKIQRHLLPQNETLQGAFSEACVIWKPSSIVGGDIYWLKKFDKGTVLCACDCTGHGTPGALLTMFLFSALETVVSNNNCHDTADIIWRLDRRFAEVFGGDKNADGEIKDGCDMAALFIAHDGNITLSSGHTNVFICDGDKVRRIRGQGIFVGEGSLGGKNDVETINIPANPANKFYIASDGLFDQPGGELAIPFGYKRFENLILENHDKTIADASQKIWETFEKYRGEEARVDDLQLITFRV